MCVVNLTKHQFWYVGYRSVVCVALCLQPSITVRPTHSGRTVPSESVSTAAGQRFVQNPPGVAAGHVRTILLTGVCYRQSHQFQNIHRVLKDTLFFRFINPRVQAAQLSGRGRAMLSVIEYFAKSLKVKRNDTLQYGMRKSLLEFQA